MNTLKTDGYKEVQLRHESINVKSAYTNKKWQNQTSSIMAVVEVKKRAQVLYSYMHLWRCYVCKMYVL